MGAKDSERAGETACCFTNSERFFCFVAFELGLRLYCRRTHTRNEWNGMMHIVFVTIDVWMDGCGKKEKREREMGKSKSVSLSLALLTH